MDCWIHKFHSHNRPHHHHHLHRSLFFIFRFSNLYSEVPTSRRPLMKFGKEFQTHLEETLPEWRDKFLCYKLLKKFLKQISIDPDYLNSLHTQDASAQRGNSWNDLEDGFVRILEEELEKFNDFYVDKEEEFVIRLQELKERIERVKEKSRGQPNVASRSEFSDEMLHIRKDFVTIHGEMVLLKNYSSLNFTGLVKILKKHDKRTGGLLRLPFTQRALHQPFYHGSSYKTVIHSQSGASEASSLQKDTLEIYRSTLAAMKAIQGLRRASSTYSPLSFAAFFQNQVEDGNGYVTAENSVSNSTTTLQNENANQEEADQDDVHSNN